MSSRERGREQRAASWDRVNWLNCAEMYDMGAKDAFASHSMPFRVATRDDNLQAVVRTFCVRLESKRCLS